MARIPRDPSFDSTIALARDPYGFITARCRRFGTDVFESRLLLRRTVCMSGPEAARIFYDPSRFMRRGAAPVALQKTLLGRGGVQSLDGKAHAHRKRLFLSIVTPIRVASLVERAAREWRSAAESWRTRQEIELYHALHEPMTRAVCAWAGVPLADAEVTLRTRQLTALFDAAGSFGPAHWAARFARSRAEAWAADVVQRVREGRLAPAADTAAARVAEHRGLDGELLDPRTAAVELLNVLRPTVAVSVFIVFVAHALHEHPECRRKLRGATAFDVECFVQEVRRLYPFFPAVPALVRTDFGWRDYTLRAGTRALFDLHGTNRDPRGWEAPDEFRPERFACGIPDPFSLVPQGGGIVQFHHRCPGEGVTVALMQRATRLFVDELEYDVPQQDLDLDTTRLPALPRSGFVIGAVRPR